MAKTVKRPNPPAPLHTYDVFAADGTPLGYVRRHAQRQIGWTIYKRQTDGTLPYVGSSSTRREAVNWLEQHRAT